MIKAFFLDKFEYDFFVNKQWIERLLENENVLNDTLIKGISHIINVHHIWITRLEGAKSESNFWDILPSDYWLKLAQDNYRRTVNFLEQYELDAKLECANDLGITFDKELIDILYHVLNHSNYHRAQVSVELRQLGITPPNAEFVFYKN